MRSSGASASNTARFQNGLVESCMLLRSIVKPYVVIALTVLGLGLSFIINDLIVKKLGIALAFLGFAARTLTVIGSFLFVGEAGASDIVNRAVEQLELEYKKAEEKVDVEKARFFSAVYVNSLVNNAQVRAYLAPKIRDIYALAKDKYPKDVVSYFKLAVLSWAESMVPKRESDGGSVKTPQLLAKIPLTVTEYTQQRDFVDESESASQVEVEQLSRRTTEVGEATRTILENVISSFIPEFALEGPLAFVGPLYEKLTDGLAEGLTEKIVEGVDPQQSIAQIHDTVKKKLQSEGFDIEAAIEQNHFQGGTFKEHVGGLVEIAIERWERAKAEQLRAEREKEKARERPEIR
jgi:hypothetical protein